LNSSIAFVFLGFLGSNALVAALRMASMVAAVKGWDKRIPYD
jgi:hypothetical protein